MAEEIVDEPEDYKYSQQVIIILSEKDNLASSLYDGDASFE